MARLIFRSMLLVLSLMLLVPVAGMALGAQRSGETVVAHVYSISQDRRFVLLVDTESAVRIPVELPRTARIDLIWSPDRHRVIIPYHDDGQTRVSAFDLRTGDTFELPAAYEDCWASNTPSDYLWSPDGRRALFNCHSPLGDPVDGWHVFDFDVGTAQMVYPEPNDQTILIRAMIWARDGQSLWVAEENQILRVDATSGEQDILHELDSGVTWGASSPDGNWRLLAFASGSGSQIARISTDGETLETLVEQVTLMEPPIWSPDGSQILMVASVKDNVVPQVLDIASETITTVSDDSGLLVDTCCLTWSPDGTHIGVQVRTYRNSNLTLPIPLLPAYSLTLDTGDLHPLGENIGIQLWSRDSRYVAVIEQEQADRAQLDSASVPDDWLVVRDSAANFAPVATLDRVGDVQFSDESLTAIKRVFSRDANVSPRQLFILQHGTQSFERLLDLDYSVLTFVYWE